MDSVSTGCDEEGCGRGRSRHDQAIPKDNCQIRSGKFRTCSRTGLFNRKPFDEFTFQSQERAKPDRWEDRRYETASFKRRIVNVIEPIFEHDFAEHSYGFRPDEACKDALRRVDQLVKQGYVHIVDADLKSYFDSIPHERLMDRRGELGENWGQV